MKEKITALYERLSRDDEQQGESNSIIKATWNGSYSVMKLFGDTFRGLTRSSRCRIRSLSSWNNGSEKSNVNYRYTADYDQRLTFNIERYLNRRMKLKATDEYEVAEVEEL